MDTSYRFLWVDCEMSGLDANVNQLLEIACIISDGECNSLVEGPEIVIHASEEHLSKMDEWNTSHHGASGLTKKCIESKISVEEAETMILDFLTKNNIQKMQLTIAGNSIHQDRIFIQKYMPKLTSFIHYRIFDVTTLKTMMDIHQPTSKFLKKGTHRALDDIR